MQKQTPNQLFQRLSDTVELLDNSSKQLMKIMEDQIDAIIASDTLKVDALTEAHTSLSWYYKEHEKQFIYELTNLLNEASRGEVENVRLTTLKEYFPEKHAEVDHWYEVISENTKELQRKHKQVLELLEFAMKQNANLMHRMYSKHSEKDTRYQPSGQRSDVATGVAVNQEI
ncbi:MAG: hypothetical protein CL666_01515 [Balneola sp.]|nr:hypothetical protein [Balneola sp.]|tara:strand:+ start:81777 stop:82292 length:516 start_codon:yes stop_codon:yes gene_type:complete